MANVLLVEDDVYFTAALTVLLQEAGHTVSTGVNGKEAVSKLETGVFDCVVSDVQMPEMGGVELALWCSKNRPHLPFIMMTGFADNIATKDALDSGAVNLLYKPFTGEEMLRAVRASLAPPQKTSVAGDCIFEGFTKIPSRAIPPGMSEFNLYYAAGEKLQKRISRGEPFKPQDPLYESTPYLYTEVGNLYKLTGLNIMITRALVRSDDVECAKKARALRDTDELIAAAISVLGLTANTLTDVLEFAKCCLDAAAKSSVKQLYEKLAVDKPRRADSLAAVLWAAKIADDRELDVKQRGLLTAAAVLLAMGQTAERLVASGHFDTQTCELIQLQSQADQGEKSA